MVVRFLFLFLSLILPIHRQQGTTCCFLPHHFIRTTTLRTRWSRTTPLCYRTATMVLLKCGLNMLVDLEKDGVVPAPQPNQYLKTGLVAFGRFACGLLCASKKTLKTEQIKRHACKHSWSLPSLTTGKGGRLQTTKGEPIRHLSKIQRGRQLSDFLEQQQLILLPTILMWSSFQSSWATVVWGCATDRPTCSAALFMENYVDQ